ncbi:hypothetical protein PsorP6_004156 [Peronosclerospora sorghi]|uniref:Uncharacterized protein n=1 Tax=Peronosclerospora sorghi TaxID=230839 RepID=A0ACC0VK50_9STRA|nr:hypothetical protein PsorP6_004156 [Peronosclerospora sorghi]
MTIRQKAAQMTQMDIYSMVNGKERDPKKALKRDVVALYARAGVGSIFNSPFAAGPLGGRTGWNTSEWRDVIQQIHQIYKEEGAAVPVLYGIDTIHGATYVQGATLFAQPINAAASFNPELIFRMGVVAAKDTLNAGIPWIFSPVLGVSVQPKWSRVYETFGEDPLLSSVVGAALIRGLQSSGNVAACMKHFIGYSNIREGLDRADSVITDWELVNYYAPPFLAAVRAGVRTAMESYVSINGEPVIASRKILIDLLRHDMNFTGLLVSDYGEVDRMYYEHHLVPNVAAAIQVAMKETSLDMNMSPNLQAFGDTIEALVAGGIISENHLDESVRRILETKRDLGLLDVNFYNKFARGITKDNVDSAADQKDALKLAQESAILLENHRKALPIDLHTVASVFVTGPVSDNKGFQCGGWSVFWQGSSDSTIFPNGLTLKEAIEKKAASSGSQTKVEHLEVVDIDGNVNAKDFQRGLQLAAKSEYTLVALGEPNYAEKSGDLLESKEVVLLFVAQKYRRASVPETKMLKAFKKLDALEPGASQEVEFVLTSKDWSYFEPHVIGRGFHPKAEAGEYVVSLLPSLTESSEVGVSRLQDNSTETSSQTISRGGPGHMYFTDTNLGPLEVDDVGLPSISFYVIV